MKIISKSVAETDEMAKNFLHELKSPRGRPQGNEALATVVGLFGDLGSGKTTFTQAVGKILGIQEKMTSPTFVIMKKYKVANTKFSTLIHIDAYRLESAKEILNLNLQEDMNNPANLILIEWPERIADALPKDILKVKFKFITEFERGIEF